MKAKVLKQLATLQFEVLAYTMKSYKCNTLDELVKKLSYCYISEDAHRIAGDLQYSYETRNIK